MKWVRLSSWGIGAAMLAFFAIASTPHAARNLEKFIAGRGAQSRVDSEAVSDNEWEKLGAWMETNKCARRYQFINRLPDGPQKDHVKQLMAERFRQIDRIRDPALKSAVVAEAQAQDQIFGVQIDYRRPDRKSVQAIGAMRKAVENLIDAEMAEKSIRAARLQTEVQTLREKKKQPEFVDNLAKNYLNRAANPHALRSPGEPGPGSSSGSDAEQTDASK
jgi:hypothetical protein